MGEDKRGPQGTSPGFATPLGPSRVPDARAVPIEEVTLADATKSPEAERAPPQTAHAKRGTPAIDIDLIHERRTAPLPDSTWVFVEVWSQNRIYALDANLVCIDVVDQSTRKSVPGHAMLGARMVGGQSRNDDAMELSHPFPRPGSEAVFEHVSGRHVRFSQTSPVVRVVMRLRVLTVAPDRLLPTWESVSQPGTGPKEND